MEREKEFRERLESRNIAEEEIAFCIREINVFLQDRIRNDKGIEGLKHYCETEIAGKKDAVKRITALVRFCSFNPDQEALIYLYALLGTQGIIESQKERLISLKGEDLAESIFTEISFPPLGSSLEEYPQPVNQYLTRMKEKLSLEDCQTVLAGNHHRIPEKIFDNEINILRELGDIDKYLVQKHQKLVDELQVYCDSGELWFEQKITQAVVDMVKENQEIQTGVRKGRKIYLQKIPYNPDAFLRETDPVQKRYYACHCPFVRTSIIENKTKISSLWCYCTGGFEKLAWDVMFNQSLQVELLESVLDGYERCRFAIELPEEADNYIKSLTLFL